jgi:type IV secretion system protein VirB8
MNKEQKYVKNQYLKQYLDESKGLERDYIGEILKSRQMAWRVSVLVAVLGFMGLLAGIFGTKREAPTPLVLRVDNATGAVDVITAMRQSETSYGETIDKYWLNLYVLDRESYDYNTIQQLYDTTALLSNDDVQKEYGAIFEGDQARDKILNNHTRIIVKIRSITLGNSGESAVVRFTTQKKHSNGVIDQAKNYIATIGYTYASAPISEENRRINPLGFQVTSYRVDHESVVSNVE